MTESLPPPSSFAVYVSVVSLSCVTVPSIVSPVTRAMLIELPRGALTSVVISKVWDSPAFTDTAWVEVTVGTSSVDPTMMRKA